MPVHASGPAYTARLPFALGCLFIVLICCPGFFELPAGISLGMALMLMSFPIWFGAARMRAGPVMDPEARLCAGIILHCVAFLVFWALISVIGADDPFRSGRTIVSLLGFIAMFLLLTGTATQMRLHLYVKVLCFALAATCAITFLAYFEPNLRRTVFRGTDRAAGFFKNPNQFGMAISTTIPVVVGTCLTLRQGRRGWITCFLLLVLGLVLSGSKMNLMLSVMTSTAMVLVVAFVSYTGAKRMAVMGLGLGGVVLFLLVMVLLLSVLNPRALDLLRTFLADEGQLQSLTSRSLLWEDSIKQFLERPILGQGAGQPLDIIEQNKLVAHSHNVVLEYVRTLGAPGLIAIVIMLGTVAVVSLRSILAALLDTVSSVPERVMTIGLLLGSLSYLAANFSSDSMGPSTSPFLWATLFLGLTGRSLLHDRAASAWVRVGPSATDRSLRRRRGYRPGGTSS